MRPPWPAVLQAAALAGRALLVAWQLAGVNRTIGRIEARFDRIDAQLAEILRRLPPPEREGVPP